MYKPFCLRVVFPASGFFGGVPHVIVTGVKEGS